MTTEPSGLATIDGLPGAVVSPRELPPSPPLPPNAAGINANGTKANSQPGLKFHAAVFNASPPRT